MQWCVEVVTRNKKCKCDGCVTESASNSSKLSDASNTCILDAINVFRKENDKWDANLNALGQVREDVSCIKSDVGCLKEQLLELKLS